MQKLKTSLDSLPSKFSSTNSDKIYFRIANDVKISPYHLTLNATYLRFREIQVITLHFVIDDSNQHSPKVTDTVRLGSLVGLGKPFVIPQLECISPGKPGNRIVHFFICLRYLKTYLFVSSIIASIE